MDDRKLYLTPEGAEKIQAELDELRGPRRTEMAGRLRHAVLQGDLSENADYIAAKEAQAFLEGRIQELEAIVRAAEVVEGDGRSDVVEIGSRVVVQEAGAPPETFHVVGAREADPRAGKVSNESPIGQALLGRRVGETIVAKTPGGELRLVILEIEARRAQEPRVVLTRKASRPIGDRDAAWSGA